MIGIRIAVSVILPHLWLEWKKRPNCTSEMDSGAAAKQSIKIHSIRPNCQAEMAVWTAVVYI